MSTKGDVPSFNICTVPGTAVKHVAVAVSLPTEDTVVEAPTTPRVKNAADMFSSSLLLSCVVSSLLSTKEVYLCRGFGTLRSCSGREIVKGGSGTDEYAFRMSRKRKK